MVEIPFIGKIIPKNLFSVKFFSSRPSHIVGVDIGTFSTKVVQLRYEKERGILETYGELVNDSYFHESSTAAPSFLKHPDNEIVALLKNLFKEANVTAKDAVFAVPANSSFVAPIMLPTVEEKELREVIPYEARRYIPIPISEVVLDWEILGQDEERDKIEVLLIAIPRETMEKFKRIEDGLGVKLHNLEIESFSMARSLKSHDLAPTAFINFGHRTMSLAITDMGTVRIAHSLSRGSSELTQALERGLGINKERAETMKKDIGLSDKIEEKEIVSILAPLVEGYFSEIQRFITIYNRRSPRVVQRINFTGGGANLKRLIEYAVNKFGMEVTRGSPFSNIVTPAFMQPILREIGPSFSVAVGLALSGIMTKKQF